MLDFQRTADALISIARPILLKNWEQLKKQPDAMQTKQNGELVSKGERQAELAMVKHLKQHYPEHGIIGEESGIYNIQADYCWVIDPIDGSSAMQQVAKGGAGGFGIMVGLLYQDLPVLGCVHDLLNNKTYSGTETNIISATAPYKIATTVPDVMFKTASQQKAFQHVKEQHKIITNLNCLGYVDLMLGNVEAVWEGDLAFYDIVPLIAPLEQAGMVITDERGNALDFSREHLNQEYRIFTAKPAVHKALLPLVTQATMNLDKPAESRSASSIWGGKFPGL